MSSNKKRIILDKASTVAFRFGERVFLSGTIEQAERRGEKLGLMLYRLDKKHRERTHANLKLAYPEWSDEERIKMATEVYRHFGRITADFMRSSLRTVEEINSAEFVGKEHLDPVLAQGKGAIFVTAHYGNWERFVHWSSVNGHSINVVARDANQSAINDRLTAIRNQAGAKVLPRGNAARAILTKLKAGEIIGILCDQNNGDCFVPFFGKPCGTALGPAVLHLRTGAPLVPCFFTRLGPGKYRVDVKEPIIGTEFDKDPIKITARMNEVIEAQIRLHPEQWLWLHDRWKSARRAHML